MHDCAFILLRNPAGYDAARGTLRSFLIGVVRNLALKRMRGESRLAISTKSLCALPAIDTNSQDRAQIVARAVASLPPLQREVLILAEYEELSLEEISRAVDAELAAVKSYPSRARICGRWRLRRCSNRKESPVELNDDAKLRELMKEWQISDAPPSLDERVLGPRKPWWSFLLTGSIRIPVPAVIAIVVALLITTIALLHQRHTPPQASTSVNLRGLSSP